jgi:hypothetical protein
MAKYPELNLNYLQLLEDFLIMNNLVTILKESDEVGYLQMLGLGLRK